MGSVHLYGFSNSLDVYIKGDEQIVKNGDTIMVEEMEEKIYTSGNSFRAKAEAHQRRYRAETLKIRAGVWGHFLTQEDADSGKNFVNEAAYQAALKRKECGKGVADRTLNNMLSSQAMCFNIFTLFDSHKDIAVKVLSQFFPSLMSVTEIEIEHTPDNGIFGDQSGRGGVDCDVLLHGGTKDNQPVTIVLETKFVEQEFSICGFRKSEREKHHQIMCPDDICLRENTNSCLYVSKKNYKYWERSREYSILKSNALPDRGCPFAGPLWQLWVNFTLAHAEADSYTSGEAYFGIIAPQGNKRLLGDDQSPKIIEGFKSLLQNPQNVVYIDSDQLILSMKDFVSQNKPELSEWVDKLIARYIIT